MYDSTTADVGYCLHGFMYADTNVNMAVLFNEPKYTVYPFNGLIGRAKPSELVQRRPGSPINLTKNTWLGVLPKMKKKYVAYMPVT